MQTEVMLTGIGGQGIQLAAKTLAQAAVAEGREAMFIAHYGGSMRGGQTDASVVVADRGLRSLPILATTATAVVMHPNHWPTTRDRVRPGGIIVANADLFTVESVERSDCRVFTVPATSLAEELDARLAASMVLLAAYCVITGMVGVEALVAAMKVLVPPYRSQHLIANERALRTGHEIAVPLQAPVWHGTEAAV